MKYDGEGGHTKVTRHTSQWYKGLRRLVLWTLGNVGRWQCHRLRKGKSSFLPDGREITKLDIRGSLDDWAGRVSSTLQALTISTNSVLLVGSWIAVARFCSELVKAMDALVESDSLGKDTLAWGIGLLWLLLVIEE